MLIFSKRLHLQRYSYRRSVKTEIRFSILKGKLTDLCRQGLNDSNKSISEVLSWDDSIFVLFGIVNTINSE